MKNINAAYENIIGKSQSTVDTSENIKNEVPVSTTGVEGFIQNTFHFFTLSALSALIIFKFSIEPDAVAIWMLSVSLLIIVSIKYTSSEGRFKIGFYGLVPAIMFLILAIWVGVTNQSTYGTIVSLSFLYLF
jgi:hypothetical protein